MGRARLTIKSRLRKKKRVNPIEKLKSKLATSVRIGILSDAGLHPASDDATFSEVLLYIEFGTRGGVKEYAPFRTWVATNKDKYKRLIAALVDAYVKGDISYDKMVSTFGLVGQADLRKTMRDLKVPANAESTQLAKGAKTGTAGTKINNPTIDTGLLRQAISWVVEDK